MKGYLSAKEIACKWNISVRWVNQYIQEGRIPGVERFGKSWAIPEGVVKPERLRPGIKKRVQINDNFFERWLVMTNTERSRA